LEALDDYASVIAAFDSLDARETLLAKHSVDGAPDPGADSHPVGVGEFLHLLDGLGRETHRNVVRERSLGAAARRTRRGLALRWILVVLEGFRVAQCRESSS
jgi:hypothetical protein